MKSRFPGFDSADSYLGAEKVDNHSPYRLVQVEDFPIGSYILTKYGKYVPYYVHIQPKWQYKLPNPTELITELVTNGYNILHTRVNIDNNSAVGDYVICYEKQFADGSFIIVKFELSGIPSDWGTEWGEVMSSIQLYGDNESEITALSKSICKKMIEVEIVENNIHLITSTSRGFDTMQFELPTTTLNVELNYGKQFVPVHEKILDQLSKKNGKGLVLLHGAPGTGKTHYLKYLAASIKNKKIMFVPPYLTDFITSPEMTPFLADNANSILFIEDAERVITDRSINGSNGVSNILNLTDGILSDVLKIQIVATFNMDKHKIDSALLRKGRLIAEHCFGPLSVEDSQLVLNELGKQYTATQPMTLTEIYNIDEVEYKSADKNKIGFGYNK